MNGYSRRIGIVGAVGILALTMGLAMAQTSTQPAGTSRPADEDGREPVFGWVDVYLDSGDVPLAAYQFELAAAAGEFEIVGVEGGEHGAFAEPPYYDPAALHNNRVIIAAFNTDDELPQGRTRVARIHVLVEGEAPQYVATLIVAATADGSPIPVTIQTEQGAQP